MALNISVVTKRIDGVIFPWTALNSSLLAKIVELEYSVLINHDILGRTNITKKCVVQVCKRKKMHTCIDTTAFPMSMNKSVEINLYV